ncbi:MAG: uroporphyrinogen-III synthase [Methanomassiliicoccales archaeon]|nr:uroporphyrinogen-III synthase [Methanomassiliicoccales archaeon]
MSLLLIVRPRDRWHESTELVRSFGHEAICAEVVQVKYVRPAGMDRLKKDIVDGMIAALVFASVTAVKAVDALEPGLIHSIPKTVDVIAIGPPTAKALNKAGIMEVKMPDEYTSQGLVRLLSSGKGEVAMLRSGQGNDVMSKGLEGKRPLRELVVYDLQETDWSSADAALERLRLGDVKAVLHTSSMSVRLMVERSRILYPDDWRSCWTGINAAIGPPTRDTLAELGIVVQVMPPNATFRDLVGSVSVHITGL